MRPIPESLAGRGAEPICRCPNPDDAYEAPLTMPQVIPETAKQTTIATPTSEQQRLRNIRLAIRQSTWYQTKHGKRPGTLAWKKEQLTRKKENHFRQRRFWENILACSLTESSDSEED